MKCEICKCDTYVIHINAKHEKICTECYQISEKDGNMSPTLIDENKKAY